MSSRWVAGIGVVVVGVVGPMWTGCNPSPLPPPPVALYAEASMSIGADSRISASVAVRQIEPLPTTTVEEEALAIANPPQTAQLIVHPGAHVGTDSSCHAIGTVVANSIVAEKSACLGDALTSQIRGKGTASSVAPFPLTALTPLPLAPSPNGGASDIDVASNTQTTLAPDNYGSVTIQKGGTLVLASGDYSFASLTMRGHTKLTTSGAGVTVLVGGVTTNSNVTLAPASGFTAGDLELVVSHDVAIGASSSVTALIAAPHGTLTLGDDVGATGSFAAFSVVLEKHVTVAYQSGFPASPHGSQQLAGYTALYADGSFGAISPLEREKVFSISLGLPYPHKAALDAFIADVSNPRSQNYRKYVTLALFKQMFSPSDDDYAQVVRWVIAHGLTVQHTFTNNLVVTASGTAAQFEKALNVNLFYRVGGPYAPGFIAVDREPSLDLAPQLLWISGFTDSVTPIPQVCNPTYPKLLHPNNLTTIDAVYGYGGDQGRDFGSSDLRQAYLEDHQGTDTLDCLGLTGSGQTIGILALHKTDVTERDSYFSHQPWIDASLSVPAITVSDPGNIPDDDDHEAILDLDMASAMAPQATVQVFQGSTGISGHVTDLVNTMATFVPVLSSISNSYSFGYDGNTNQTLAEFAAQGTSYFSASGDYGDIGDPENSTDFDYQTNVGGTVLNVGTATVDDTSGTYALSFIGPLSGPYYIGEESWTGGCPGIAQIPGTAQFGFGSKSITGGGILNGHKQTAVDCYATTCKDGGIPIPEYQTAYFIAHPPGPIIVGSSPEIAVSDSGNGASVQYRNYPDVSAVAQDVVTWVGEQHIDNSGTSAAAPIWAGYAALINQALKSANVGGSVGFANPVLYAVGAGNLIDRSGHDASIGAFHDENDCHFNQEPQPNTYGAGGIDLGFPAVRGYDISTGLGSPTCHLLNLLSSPAPLTPPVVPPTFDTIFGEISVGEDNLNAQSQAFLYVDTTSATYSWPLKLAADGSWERGTAHSFHVPIPPVAVSDVVDVRVVLDENGQGGTDLDNWDVNGIHIRLGNSLNPLFACLVNESGDDSCDPDQPSCHSNTGFLGDTTDHGVFRLSAVAGTGGQGPSATITIAQETARFQSTTNGPAGVAAQGCPSFNFFQPVKPIHSVHVVIDTGNDGMNAASTGTIFVVDQQNNSLGAVNIPLGALPISDRSEIGYDVTLPADKDPSLIAGIVMMFNPDGNDEWHVFGTSAFANGDQPSGQDLCLVRVPEAANDSQQDNTFVFNNGQKSHTFARTEASCGGL